MYEQSDNVKRSGVPTHWERELVRKVQQSLAFVKEGTGEVYQVSNEFTGETPYLGTLRRKLIPFHRIMERAERETKKAGQKAQLDEIVRDPPASESCFPWNSSNPNWWKGQF